MNLALQQDCERRENIADLREQFANGLYADLKNFGIAWYHENGEHKNITAEHVIQHIQCDLDALKVALFLSPPNDVFTANRLREAMNEKALELVQMIAEEVIS